MKSVIFQLGLLAIWAALVIADHPWWALVPLAIAVVDATVE